MKLLQVNFLPELSGFLKYGLIGLGAILAILSYLLLRAEQKKRPKRISNINGIYAFMLLSVIIIIVGLLAPPNNDKAQQNTSIELNGSNNNTVNSQQSQGDTSLIQNTDLKLTQSDSNNVTSNQIGRQDTTITNQKGRKGSVK